VGKWALCLLPAKVVLSGLIFCVKRKMTNKILSILCIDDDESILEIVKLCLDFTSNAVVEICLGGQTGLERIKTIRPDIILLDVMMPDMHGEQVLLDVRQNPDFDETAIIFMTARAQQEEIERYISLGVAGVITKPFEPMSLYREITLLRESWNDRQRAVHI